MAIYLLKNKAAKTAKNTRQLVVAAASAAHARIIAGVYFSGDGSWSEAEATALASGTLDDASTMTGFIWKITITGAAAQVSPNQTLTAQVTGAASADLDALAAYVASLGTSSLPRSPFRQANGGFTTRAASSRSLTTTFTASPGATPAGRRASAIDWLSVGLNVPLVISPSPCAVCTAWCARRTARRCSFDCRPSWRSQSKSPDALLASKKT
jgi:hypothetical protein